MTAMDYGEVIADVMEHTTMNTDVKGLPKSTRYPTPTTEIPSMDQIREWVFDSVCEATDGCTVEPDGVCEHGYPSWLIHLGLI